ncbi:MAG: hypothetical protein J6386_08380 [Candidatus Synoicihabitans palmerolidicus]|nr:hypothetical protein [Candidatus Synoicihabitans palmerolidicus]
MQLRATLADSVWRTPHPLSPALAFASPGDRELVACNMLTDLYWSLPHSARADELLGRIASHHRSMLLPLIEGLLQREGISPASLVQPPVREQNRICAYCPRCHDQFILAGGQCPHGIALLPLTK